MTDQLVLNTTTSRRIDSGNWNGNDDYGVPVCMDVLLLHQLTVGTRTILTSLVCRRVDCCFVV